MIDPSIFVSTELDYRINRTNRSNRVRKGTSAKRRGRSRNPFARRPAEKSDLDG